MKMSKLFGLAIGASALVCLLGVQGAFAANVAFLGSLTDVTDYQAAGIGNDGYLFANWDQSSIVSGEEDLNSISTLPSWFNINSDQSTAFYSWQTVEDISIDPPPYTSTVLGYGGDSDFADLTLPDGTTGRSGQFVDTDEAGNTGQNSNTLQFAQMGAGVPSNFRVHVVVDNEDAGFGTGVRRVKMRVFDPSEHEADTTNAIDGTRNNVPDVHTFQFTDVQPGDFLQIALRTTNSPIGGLPANILGAGMAGFMIDIPEPASIVLMGLGLCGIGLVRRR